MSPSSSGEALLAGKQLEDNVGLFADIFEIGRRYKIMNPGKMRDTYGKLMFILMVRALGLPPSCNPLALLCCQCVFVAFVDDSPLPRFVGRTRNRTASRNRPS